MNKGLIIIILLIAFSCKESDDTVNSDEIINLVVLDFNGNTEITEAIGDGETIVTLKATIPENSDENSRTVTFQASNNAVFQGVGTSLETDVADTDGIAEAKLRMPLDDDPVFLSAAVTKDGNTYTSEATISLIGVDEIVSLELLDADENPLTEPQRADGLTLIKLKATVNYNQEVFDQVTFEKSAGVFQSVSGDSATKDIDEENSAAVDLRVPIVVDRIYLLAKVGPGTTYFEEVEIDLLRAYPDHLLIEPTSLTMTENTTNNIKVFLNRNLGLVSQGTEATFESFQVVNGVEVEAGRFTGLASAQTNVNGQIMVEFKTDTGNLDLSLPVIIRVSSQNDAGDTVQSTISINLN